jgi:hypothetical protein
MQETNMGRMTRAHPTYLIEPATESSKGACHVCGKETYGYTQTLGDHDAPDAHLPIAVKYLDSEFPTIGGERIPAPSGLKVWVYDEITRGGRVVTVP